MPSHQKFRANPVVSFRDEGDEGAVLYNPDTDKCVIINPVGSVIWCYLEEPRTSDDILSMLLETFSDVDEKKARKDVEQFINELEEDFIDEVS